MSIIFSKMLLLVEEIDDLTLASDPATHPRKLQSIYDKIKNPSGYDYIHIDENPELHHALMRNPNTPLPILGDYIRAGRKEPFNNDIIPLVPLEDNTLTNLFGPDEMLGKGVVGRVQAAKNTTLPAFLKILVSHPDKRIHSVALRNPHLPKEDFDNFFNTAENDMNKWPTIGAHPNSSPELLSKIIDKIPDPPEEKYAYKQDPRIYNFIDRLFERGNLKPEYFNKLESHILSNKSFAVMAARHHATPAHILEKLSKGQDSLSMSDPLIYNPNTPATALHNIATREMWDHEDSINNDEFEPYVPRDKLLDILNHKNAAPETQNMLINHFKKWNIT